MTDEAVAFRSLMPISAMSYPVLDVVTKVVTKVDTLAYDAPARRCDDRLHRSVPASGQRKAVDEDTRIRRVEHANRTIIDAFARSAHHAQDPGAFAARA